MSPELPPPSASTAPDAAPASAPETSPETAPEAAPETALAATAPNVLPTEVTLVAPITAVTVHPGMARVERTLSLTPNDALNRLVITGLPPLLQESSVQIRLEQVPFEVVSLSLGWDVPGAEAPELGPLELQVKAAKLTLDQAAAHENHLKTRAEFWSAMAPETFDEPALPKDGRSLVTDLSAADTAWAENLEGVESRLEGLHKALQEARAALKNARQTYEALEANLRRQKSTGLTGAPRRTLALSLSRKSDGEWGTSPRLFLTYLTPGATWQPAYEVRLSQDWKSCVLRLRAFIAQHTGEDWAGVTLSVSTADARYVTELPTLSSMRIGRAQPPPRTGWRPAPEGLSGLFEGFDRDRPKNLPRKPRLPAMPTGGVMPPMLSPAQFQALEDGRDPSEITGSHDLNQLMKEVALDEAEEEGGAESDRRRAPKGKLRKGGPPAPPLAAAPIAAAPMAPPQPAPPMMQGMPPGVSPSMPAPPMPRSASIMADMPARAGAAFGAAREMSKKVAETAVLSRHLGGAPGGGGMAYDGSALEPPEPPAAIDADTQWLSFDALRMAGPDEPRRGQLVYFSPQALLQERLPQDQLRAQVESYLSQLEGRAHHVNSLPLPPYTRPWYERVERFDHRYDASHPLDVPSDGRFHALTLLQQTCGPKVRYATVPKLEPVVYRELILQNPFAGPLLSGPCDLYSGGSLLATSQLDQVGRGGNLRLGLGVEDRVKVARNVYYKESAPGLLSTTLGLEHDVQLTLSSQLAEAIQVEVMEAVPVTDADDVEIKELASQPTARPYDQVERGQPLRGGRLLLVPVPARGQANARIQWRVNLNAKLELVGGNRRD